MSKVKITMIIILCVIAVIAVAACVFFFASPSHENVVMIGHRGYSSKHVDNTAESFIAAAEHGSKGVETDVRITKDGMYVLSHDSDVTFFDGTKAVVSETNYADLIKKPLKNEYTDADVYLCSLKEYLEICKEHNMICFIELKGKFDNAQIKEVFDYIAMYYDLNMCELQSFDFDMLIEAQKMFPELHFMLTWGKDRGDYSRCFEYGFDIDAQYGSLSPKMVKEFHERGLKVAAWTCNDPISLHYCYWYSLDYIESDVY